MERAMRGTLLAFDFRTGRGEISGEDGARYQFADSEWRAPTRPHIGQPLDFQPSATQAVAIYSLATPGVRASRKPIKPKSKFVAAIFALLFGALGFHKFYLGKTGAGVTMLLLSILVLPFPFMILIALIECLIYLTIPHGDFEERYVLGDRSWF
jgi:TM2 domain-containing membrane protein YozV